MNQYIFSYEESTPPCTASCLRSSHRTCSSTVRDLWPTLFYLPSQHHQHVLQLHLQLSTSRQLLHSRIVRNPLLPVLLPLNQQLLYRVPGQLQTNQQHMRMPRQPRSISPRFSRSNLHLPPRTNLHNLPNRRLHPMRKLLHLSNLWCWIQSQWIRRMHNVQHIKLQRLRSQQLLRKLLKQHDNYRIWNLRNLQQKQPWMHRMHQLKHLRMPGWIYAQCW